MSSHSNMHTLDIHSATPSEILSLSNIRSVLIRLEETIVFQLIERAQFAHNPKCYSLDGFPELKQKEGWNSSWLAWFLKETESTHAKVRRFEAPDEYPFTDPTLLPKPVLAPVKYPELLWKHEVNVNDQIMEFYVNEIVPDITKTLGIVSTIQGARRWGRGVYDANQTETSLCWAKNRISMMDIMVLQLFAIWKCSVP